MRDLPSVLKLAEAVHGGSPTLHFGREATVVAVGPLRGFEYHPNPVVVSTTCKSETGAEFSVILERVMEQWKLHAQAEHGPLWFIGSDGDAVFRAAGFKLLMKQPLDPSSDLYNKLCDLNGLNLFCGSGGIIMSPDHKHTVKREFKSALLNCCFMSYERPSRLCYIGQKS